MDRLVVQPTSLRAYWTHKDMTPLVQTYLLGDKKNSDARQDENADHSGRNLLERLDIVSPTADYMEQVFCQGVHGLSKRRRMAVSALDLGYQPRLAAHTGSVNGTTKDNDSGRDYLFLSS